MSRLKTLALPLVQAAVIGIVVYASLLVLAAIIPTRAPVVPPHTVQKREIERVGRLVVEEMRTAETSPHQPVRQLHRHIAETLYEVMCRNRGSLALGLADIYRADCLGYAQHMNCYAFSCAPETCPRHCWLDVRMR